MGYEGKERKGRVGEGMEGGECGREKGGVGGGKNEGR